jgi:hypothetical protein
LFLVVVGTFAVVALAVAATADVESIALVDVLSYVIRGLFGALPLVAASLMSSFASSLFGSELPK